MTDKKDIPLDVMALLKREAKRLHLSVNSLVLKMIERGLGMTHERPTYYDLDHLAGSWPTVEAKAFKANTLPFGQIDKDL